MKKTGLFLFFSLLLYSCHTSQKVLYLQDINTNTTNSIKGDNILTVKPLDMLYIIVSSKDVELALIFNLSRMSYGTTTNGANYGANNQISAYTVDSEGDIDFPVLGGIHVEGLTRSGVSALIKNKLIDQKLLKDPIVTVDFANLNVSVIGEVKNPGKFSVNKDRISLFEALSLAGDLTIYGKRNNVLVIREVKGRRNIYSIDLRSASLFDSPAYYLQQNDVVYVQPNSVRAGQSTINENNLKSVSLWMSVASFLTTLGVLIFK
ncbi:MAG: polysaccharide biosynthesis/export family protein [Paludibacteraceae bacterium]